jgi:hypothetical protein
VRKLLVTLGFSRQSNRKADEGSHHPDRNAQFEYINKKVVVAQAKRQPVISVDTKKKELIGNFKNGGTDYRPKRQPRHVKVHDFEDKEFASDFADLFEVKGHKNVRRSGITTMWHGHDQCLTNHSPR